MAETMELKGIVEDIISSYESRIEGIGFAFDATKLVLNDFQKSVVEVKQETDKINSELRDVLAKNDHLRRKDFDAMMQSIFIKPQAEKEEEVQRLLERYITEQKEIARELRDNFAKVKDLLAKDEIEKIKGLLRIVKGLISKQDMLKEELVSKLKELKQEGQERVTTVRALLKKGRELHISDFKQMLAHIRQGRQERISQGLERKEKVRKMLTQFRERRKAIHSNAKGFGIGVDIDKFMTRDKKEV